MAGFVTVGQCEWADYPTKILEKHWPDVPRWRDIRTLTKESFYERTGLRTVDLISGGFPCQPFSVAGDRRGTDDDRFLWPEMLRVIQEIRPTWVLGENVPGIINMALDTVLTDLEDSEYSCQTFVIPACGVDAPHKRDRVAILAYSTCKQLLDEHWKSESTAKDGRERIYHSGRETENCFWKDQSSINRMVDGLRTAVHETDTDSCGSDGQRSIPSKICQWGGVQTQSDGASGMHSAWDNWTDEPGVDRVVDGIPNRVDRLRCLGNAVVPQQFYPFFEAIARIEREGEYGNSNSS